MTAVPSVAVCAMAPGCVGSLVAGTSRTGSSVTELTASSIDVIAAAELLSVTPYVISSLSLLALS